MYAAGQILHSIHECDGKDDSCLQRTTTLDESQVAKENLRCQPVLNWADFCVLVAEFYCRSHPQSGKEEDSCERWGLFCASACVNISISKYIFCTLWTHHSSIDAAVQSYLVPMETKKGLWYLTNWVVFFFWFICQGSFMFMHYFSSLSLSLSFRKHKFTWR